MSLSERAQLDHVPLQKRRRIDSSTAAAGHGLSNWVDSFIIIGLNAQEFGQEL